MKASSKLLLNVASLACLLAVRAPAQPLSAIDKNTTIATLHAEGAQIYECKLDTSKPAGQARALTWQFREPIATLMVGGQSVGRHYAGPSWDLVDGGTVKGRVVTSTPAPTANDIPWLELEVIDHRNKEILSDAVTVLRINTKGGLAQGSCESEGKYLSIPLPRITCFCAGAIDAPTATAQSSELIRLFKSATRMFDLATKDICGAEVPLLPVSSINS